MHICSVKLGILILIVAVWYNIRMTWDDIDDILYDGTEEEIKAVRCPICGGVFVYRYYDAGKTLTIECKGCGYVSRAHGGKRPNCADFADNTTKYMKVRYIGPDTGVGGLHDGNIYECIDIEGDEELGSLLRIIDEDGADWNYNNDPDWKPGYLYSATRPGNIEPPYQYGRFEIIEDDDQGSLRKAIYGDI